MTDDGAQLDFDGGERPWREAMGAAAPDPPGVMTVREVADAARLSTHAVYRAIKRGDLVAFEPVPGRLRIERADFEQWWDNARVTPSTRPVSEPSAPSPARRRTRRPEVSPDGPGSLAALRAIEAEAGR
jgi:excisionase family DNA binding protein